MQNLRVTTLILLFLLFASAVAQTFPTNSANQLQLSRIREIPVASLPCTSEETDWWGRLHDAAVAVRKNRESKKERQKFLDLLEFGQEKSYQPPVPDMKPFILSKFEPAYSEQARAKRISGTVIVEAESRADGFVGEVRIVKSAGYGLDEKAAEATRRTIFIPAVRDRRFVSYQVRMELNFSTY